MSLLQQAEIGEIYKPRPMRVSIAEDEALKPIKAALGLAGEYKIFKSSSGLLYEASGCAPDANAWLCIVDKATAPTDGDPVDMAVYVAASVGSGFFSFAKGWPCDAGIALCFSSTPNVVTITPLGYFSALFR